MKPHSPLAEHLIEYLRLNKPALRELAIPQYVDRLLSEIEIAGYAVRKKAGSFKPSPHKREDYLRRVYAWADHVRPDEWSAAFPGRDIMTEVRKAGLWLKAQAEAGKYKTRFDQFFHNWLSRSTPTSPAGTFMPSEKAYLSTREKIIATGIRELAASRSERVYPSDMETRISLAMQDLAHIPETDLPEVFRRARSLPLKSTPGLIQIHESWHALQTDRRKAENKKAEEKVRERERIEDERWNAMTQEEQAKEMEKIRADIQRKLK